VIRMATCSISPLPPARPDIEIRARLSGLGGVSRPTECGSRHFRAAGEADRAGGFPHPRESPAARAESRVPLRKAHPATGPQAPSAPSAMRTHRTRRYTRARCHGCHAAPLTLFAKNGSWSAPRSTYDRRRAKCRGCT
jgi:hypothetical protein